MSWRAGSSVRSSRPGSPWSAGLAASRWTRPLGSSTWTSSARVTSNKRRASLTSCERTAAGLRRSTPPLRSRVTACIASRAPPRRAALASVIGSPHGSEPALSPHTFVNRTKRRKALAAITPRSCGYAASDSVSPHKNGRSASAERPPLHPPLRVRLRTWGTQRQAGRRLEHTGDSTRVAMRLSGDAVRSRADASTPSPLLSRSITGRGSSR